MANCQNPRAYVEAINGNMARGALWSPASQSRRLAGMRLKQCRMMSSKGSTIHTMQISVPGIPN